jgi:hypothetical protein
MHANFIYACKLYLCKLCFTILFLRIFFIFIIILKFKELFKGLDYLKEYLNQIHYILYYKLLSNKMDYTYLDYFNYYLKTFLNELVSNFPDVQKSILANYRPLLEGRDDKSDMYVKYYYTKINNFLGQIAKRDESLFATPGTVLIEGADFNTIWNSSTCTEEHKKAIWMYLQILMILGRKIIPNHNEIKDMLEKISGGIVSVPAKVEKTLADISKEGEDLDKGNSGMFNLGNIASGLGSLGSLASGLSNLGGGSGGGLGGLSGLADSLGSLGGLGGLGSSLGGIGDLLGNVDLQGMLGTFTEAMNTLAKDTQSAGDNFTNNSDANTSTSTSGDNSDNSGDNSGDNGDNGDNTDGDESGASSSGQAGTTNLFVDLAKDMAETFNFEDIAKGEEPKNVGDAFKKFMSGDNPTKLMGLVSKFGSKLQNDISSGKLNQKDLLKQTMGMMNMMGTAGANQTSGGASSSTEQGAVPNINQLQQMAQQMAASNPQMVNALRNAGKPHSVDGAKDRLRAKLAANKNSSK